MDVLMDAIEQWLPVVGWELYYTVSSWGRVRSLPRYDRLGRYHPGKILAAPVGSRGYPEVRLSVDGVGKTRTVHSLVLEAFRGPCPKGKQSRHMDGVRTHNWLSNLEWGTPRDDNFDRVRHGTHQYAKRDRCSNGHLYTPETTKIEYHPDGSFKRRVCLICDRERKAEWAEGWRETAPPCTQGCDAPQFAGGLCGRCYHRAHGGIGGIEGYEMKDCAFCGKPFRNVADKGAGVRKYCSKECAKAATRERQRQGRQMG